MPRPTFEQVYDDHASFVWRSLRGLGVPVAALEDALQDVFLVVNRRLADYVEVSKIRAWLFGIALRVARDYRRHHNKRILAASETFSDDQLADGRANPEHAASSVEELTLVQRALDALDEDERTLLFLMDLEQMSANEVAEVLSMKPTDIYRQIRKARASFARAYRKEMRP